MISLIKSLTSILLITFFVSAAFTMGDDDRPLSSLANIIDEALEMSQKQCLNEALDVALTGREKFPENPAAVFALVAIYQSYMETYRVRLFESKIDSLLNIAVKLCQKAIKQDKRDGRNFFYLAMAYGSRAARYAHRGKWLNAFSDGSKIKKNIKRALTLTPDFYDAYYGLGAYNYWTAAKAKLLRLFGDTRQEGIKQVKLAVEKGHFLKTNAHFGLAAIYFNEQMFDASLKLCDALYQKYPNNPSISYRRGRIYSEQNEWLKAKASFEWVINILKETEHQSISYQVDCLYQLARCEQALGNFKEAKLRCVEALALADQRDASKELDGSYEKFSTIEKDLKKLNEQL